MTLIEIQIEGRGRAVVELDERNPRTAGKILQILPLEADARLWEEEIYFDIPLKLQDENPSPKAQEGDVSYWSPGSAFCIFFGQSQPVSQVNHIGKVVEGLETIPRTEDGDRITLRRLADEVKEE